MNWKVSRNVLAIALIALSASACSTVRSASSEIRSKMEEVRSDTLREQVVVTVMDTVKEITTITVRESESGDTLRMTTVTDRTRASTKDRYHDVQEKVIVRTDTVYVEWESYKQSVVAGPNVEIDKEGNVIKKVNRVAQTLKWLVMAIASPGLLIIIIKLSRKF